MIERILKKKLLSLSQQYPVVTLTGPRQSGKSTLLKNTFSDYQYVSLEDPDMRDFAKNDPRGFFKTYSNRVILDEIQRVPTLFFFFFTHDEEINASVMYIFAGSQLFLLI